MGSGSLVQRVGTARARKTRVATAALIGAVLALALCSAPAWATAKLGLWTQAQVNKSVEEGVAFVDTKHQSSGILKGSITEGSGFPSISETGIALDDYAALAHGNFTNLATYSASYEKHVEEAVKWLLSVKTGNHWADYGSYDTYSTGIALAGLGAIRALSNVPSSISTIIGTPITEGREYLKQNFERRPASCAPFPRTTPLCYGWTYRPESNLRSDESNTGYALFGLQQSGGVPTRIKEEDVLWQERVQRKGDGGGSYQNSNADAVYEYSNANDSGTMLFGFAYDGALSSSSHVKAGIAFDEEVLNEYEDGPTNNNTGAPYRKMIYGAATTLEPTCKIGAAGCEWKEAPATEGGYHYSLFSITKGLGSFIPAKLNVATNWYAKVVDLAISQQGTEGAPAGAWPVNGRDDESLLLSTEFTVCSLKECGVTGRHWYSDGKQIPEGQKEKVATAGELTFRGPELELKCKLKDEEVIENPVGGASGRDEITTFALSGCQQVIADVCQPGEVLEVKPHGLPWQTVLGEENGEVFDEIANMELEVACSRGGGAHFVLHGTLSPQLPTGPSELVFNNGTGDLQGGFGGDTPTEVLGYDHLTGPKNDLVISGGEIVEEPKKGKKEEPPFKSLKECPALSNTCLEATLGGSFQVGSLTLDLTKALKLQGGLTEALGETEFDGDDGESIEVAETFQPAKDASKSLAAVKETVPKLEELVEPAALSEAERKSYTKTAQKKVTAVIELAGSPSAIRANREELESGEAAGIVLPLKITLSSSFLGKTCSIGTAEEPLTVELATGQTSPPEGVEPLTGSIGETKGYGEIQGFTAANALLVSNTYETPAASGCGSKGGADDAIDAKLGLPAAPGRAQATIQATLALVEGTAVEEHLK